MLQNWELQNTGRILRSWASLQYTTFWLSKKTKQCLICILQSCILVVSLRPTYMRVLAPFKVETKQVYWVRTWNWLTYCVLGVLIGLLCMQAPHLGKRKTILFGKSLKLGSSGLTWRAGRLKSFRMAWLPTGHNLWCQKFGPDNI